MEFWRLKGLGVGMDSMGDSGSNSILAELRAGVRGFSPKP